MAPLSKEEGIARARAALGIDPSIPARAYLIQRVDLPGKAYYLVVFGTPQSSTGVAALDQDSGDIMIFANTPGDSPHLAIDEKKAKATAGFPEKAQADLVWKPCKGSRSPLYPLWRIRYQKMTLHVDLQGGVWSELDTPDLGG